MAEQSIIDVFNRHYRYIVPKRILVVPHKHYVGNYDEIKDDIFDCRKCMNLYNDDTILFADCQLHRDPLFGDTVYSYGFAITDKGVYRTDEQEPKEAFHLEWNEIYDVKYHVDKCHYNFNDKSLEDYCNAHHAPSYIIFWGKKDDVLGRIDLRKTSDVSWAITEGKGWDEKGSMIAEALKEMADFSHKQSEQNTIFIKDFLNLPYNKRKVLMPISQNIVCQTDSFSPICIDALPKISFPLGHPIANQLYVGHPLISNKYIPFENYQLELVEDKVREFCEFVQYLGATEINIECLNTTLNDSSNSESKNINGEFEGGRKNLSASVSQQYSRHLIEELSKSISLHQKFSPSKPPCLPQNMIWYSHEVSWQRLYNQRINGGLTNHEERIETQKSQMLENRELLEIKSEIKGLFTKLNVSFDKTEESKFEQQENAVLSIKVKFAPLENLCELSSTTIRDNGNNEQEYVAEVKEYLEDYGSIGTKERKHLERTRNRLGISENRAAELEAYAATPQVTPEENEYMEEVKEYLEDYGTIGSAERKYLEKSRKRLEISEERAVELEKIVR